MSSTFGSLPENTPYAVVGVSRSESVKSRTQHIPFDGSDKEIEEAVFLEELRAVKPITLRNRINRFISRFRRF